MDGTNENEDNSLHSDIPGDGKGRAGVSEAESLRTELMKMKITSLHSDTAGNGEGRRGGNEVESLQTELMKMKITSLHSDTAGEVKE